jgi:hypothetical protein
MPLSGAITVAVRLDTPRYASPMATIKFSWHPQLVAVRRDICPGAKWIPASRTWTMTEDDTKKFLAECHERLATAKMRHEMLINGSRWAIDFIRGAPMLVH